MSIFHPAGAGTYALNSSIGSTDTSVTLSSFLEPVSGTPYTMVLLNTDIAYGTIAPRTSSSEFISFTGITQNADGTATLTGVTRGLAKKYPFTTSVTFKLPHSGQSVFILSDSPQVFEKYSVLENTETITGLKTFTQSPLVPGGATGSQAINADQLAAAVFSGASDTSTTVTGITRSSVSSDTTIGTFTVTIASPAVFTLNSHGLTVNDSVRFTTTGALPTGLAVGTIYYVISGGLTTNNFEVSTTRGGTAVNTTGSQSGTHTLIRTTPIQVGTLDPRVPTQAENDALVGNNTDVAVGTGNKFVTQTGLQHNAEKYAVDASASSTAYTETLSPVPTSLTDGMVVLVKIGVTNSTTTPTLNVNSLGAKTIVKNGNLPLSVSDIPVGLNTFIYDLTATKWIMQNPTTFVTTKVSRFTGFTPVANTTEQTVFTTTVIANAVGANGLIKVRTFVKASNGANDTYTYRLKFGGTTLATLIVTTSTIGGASPLDAYGFLEGIISNNNSASSQNVGLYLPLAPNGGNSNPSVPSVTTIPADTTSAIDTTASQTLTLTCQSSTSGQQVVLRQTIVEVINA